MNPKLLIPLALAAMLPLTQACAPLAVGAAAGGAVLMANDRRTTGIYIEDENIEWKALARIREVAPSAHVNATSYNRKVLLTGEAGILEHRRVVLHEEPGVVQFHECRAVDTTVVAPLQGGERLLNALRQ